MAEEKIKKIYRTSFVAVFSAAGLGVIFYLGLHMEVWNLVVAVVEWSSTIHPALLFGVVAIATAFPVPAAPLYAYVGATYGGMVSVLGIAGMVLVNISFGYAMAAWGLDRLVQRIIAWMGYSVPECPESEYWRFTILLRITPGLPLPIQNYILGLANVPFGKYLTASWPPAFLIGAGIALTGGGIYRGDTGSLLFGILVVTSVLIAGRIVKNYT